MGGDFRVYRSLDEAETEFGPCAITVGNFDGVHIGHQEIFRHVVAAARELGVMPSAMTFDPHPAKVLAPERAPQLLSTPEQRAEWMREAGLRQVLILPFTREFSMLTAEQFAEEVLVRCLCARAVLVGENFRFGRGKGGDSRSLAELGARFGFRNQVVPPVDLRGRVVSSSIVRRLIGEGRVSLAGRMLNRCFALDGEVVAGHGVGSKQTVPTLNLKPDVDVLPGRGVYVTHTTDLETGAHSPSVTNVGFRPTFDGNRLTVETFLLQRVEQRPQRIRVEFLYRLRDERKFDTPAQLKDQILRDVRRAGVYFRRLESVWKSGSRGSAPLPAS